MSTTLRTPWGKAIGLGLGASLAVLLIVLAFLWPSKTSTAQNLPVSIAGPEQAVTAIEAQLKEKAPDLLDLKPAADRAEAERQIRERETYGAIVLSATGAPEVLTAPAAGAAGTQVVTQLAATLQAGLTAQAQATGTQAPQVTVTAVVPLSETDPNGTGLTAAAFPLALGGVIGGVMVSLLIRGTWQRFAAAATFAAAAGGLMVWVMQAWFGYLQGNAWLNFLAIGLTILATATFMIGCVKLLGRPGMALGPIVTVLLGNPLSGTTAPWQFLPEPWGAIGQHLVPGAGNTLLRNLSYFPDAPTAAQWLTLAAWVVFGALLAIIGHGVHSRRTPAHALPDGAEPAAGQDAPQAVAA
ncbi:MAG: ABC transporter permease [Arthrobacter sp.]|jgi:hypothetical protein|nr:ABC transporter permease [Arthrobacter sp.]